MISKWSERRKLTLTDVSGGEFLAEFFKAEFFDPKFFEALLFKLGSS